MKSADGPKHAKLGCLSCEVALSIGSPTSKWSPSRVAMMIQSPNDCGAGADIPPRVKGTAASTVLTQRFHVHQSKKASPAAPRGDSGLAQLKGQRTSEKPLNEAAQIKRRVDAIYSSKSDPYCFLSHGSSANGADIKIRIDAVPTMSAEGAAASIIHPPTIAISAMY